MEFTGDNDVDVCNAIDKSYFKALKKKFSTNNDYEYLIGYIIPIINQQREKAIKKGD